MNSKIDTLEEIQATLEKLRSNSSSRRKFPKEVWDSIIRLAKLHSTKEVCEYLHINPVYLKRKIPSSKNMQALDFQEIPYNSKNICSDVVIELLSTSGLKAKIQGPQSCLNFLQSLFKE